MWMELQVNALADENGNIPSIRTPLGVRITSKDESADSSASCKLQDSYKFSWKRLPECTIELSTSVLPILMFWWCELLSISLMMTYRKEDNWSCLHFMSLLFQSTV